MATRFRIIWPLLLLIPVQSGATGSVLIEPTAVEQELAERFCGLTGQGRSECVYSTTLNMLARAKAFDMALRGYVGHVDPDGYGPNKACKLAGWILPSHYGSWLGANSIESLTGGYLSASAAFGAWLASPDHQQHLFGTGEYGQQTRFGFGHAYVPGSTYGHYYVFISAPPSPNGAENLEPYVDWLFARDPLPVIDAEDDSHDRDGDRIPRILEFAMGFDPDHADVMPAPQLNADRSKLEWTLPLLPDLGSVEVFVTQSQDLSTWSETGVSRSGTTFSVDTDTAGGFLQVECSR